VNNRNRPQKIAKSIAHAQQSSPREPVVIDVEIHSLPREPVIIDLEIHSVPRDPIIVDLEISTPRELHHRRSDDEKTGKDQG
jgi:hypothetical protein